ncbi:MAG: hypothetical protein AAGD38_17695 [Acidobacteriota bacterium]
MSSEDDGPRPMPRLCALATLLGELEATCRTTAGRLEITPLGGASPIGFAMGEAGRICWAIADGLTIRLTDRLVEITGLARLEIEALVASCRRRGVPLGEHMVELGLVSVETLRVTLRRQIVEALCVLVGEGEQGIDTRFVPATTASYLPTFTYSATEIVTAAAEQAIECAVEVGELPDVWNRFADHMDSALCLRVVADCEAPAIPVAHNGLDDLSFDDLLVLYRSALSVARPPTLQAVGVEPYATVVRYGDRNWVVSMHEYGYLCLFAAPSGERYVRLLSALLIDHQAQFAA